MILTLCLTQFDLRWSLQLDFNPSVKAVVLILTVFPGTISKVTSWSSLYIELWVQNCSLLLQSFTYQRNPLTQVCWNPRTKWPCL